MRLLYCDSHRADRPERPIDRERDRTLVVLVVLSGPLEATNDVVRILEQNLDRGLARRETQVAPDISTRPLRIW